MRTLMLLAGMTLGNVAPTLQLGAQNPRDLKDPGRSRQTAIVTAAAPLAPAGASVNVLRRERRAAQDPFDLFFMPRGAGQVGEGCGSRVRISAGGGGVTNPPGTAGPEPI